MQTIAFYRAAQSGVASFFADSEDGTPVINPHDLTTEQRVELIAKIRAGELLALRFPAHVFGSKPNLNGIRPKPGTEYQVAKTAKGVPFIVDHRLHDSAAKYGTVVDSRFDNGDVFDLVEVREPGAMEALVRGLFEQFSIRYAFDGAECSKCGTAAEEGWFGPRFACECEPGSRFKDKDTSKFRHVELFTTGNRRLELSVVNYGAYPDTEIVSAFQNANTTGEAFFGLAPINQPAQSAPEGDTMQEKTQVPAPESNAPESTTGQSAEFDELKARLEAAEKRASKAAEAAFKLAFNKGVEGMKFGAGSIEDERCVWNHRFGGDVELYAERVSKLPRNPAYSTEPIGEEATAPAPEKGKDPNSPDLSLLARFAQHGWIDKDNVKNHAESLTGLRFLD